MRKFYFLWLLALFTCWQLNAQVFVNEDFNSGALPTGWTDTYGFTSVNSCEGQSIRDNLWSLSTSGNMTTANFVGGSNGTDLTVSFDYKVVKYSDGTAEDPGWGSAEVQYSTDDGTNWIGATGGLIDDTNHQASSSCANFSVTIPAADLPAGSDVRLRIWNTRLAGDYWFYIDNFSAQQVVACPPVSGLAISDVTENSANVTWSPGGTEGAWDIEYGETGFMLGFGTPVTETPNNPYSLTGLSPNTTYDVYVRAVCGPGDASTWVGPISFTTTCSPLTATYTQNFDGTVAPAIDNCWSTLIDASTSTFSYIRTNTTESVSPDNAIRFYNSSDTNGSYYLISAPFSDIDNTKRVRFQVYKNIFNDADGDVLEVGTMTDPTMASTFTSIETFAPSDFTEDAWVEKTVSFSSYSGSDQYVVIKLSPGAGFNYWYIDDFVYEPAPSCVEPTDLTASITSPTSVDFSWTAENMETTWNIEYGEAGFVQGTGTPITATGDNPYSITGLTTGSTYDLYVQAVCGGGDVSAWVMTSVTLDYCSSVPTSNDGAGISNINFEGVDYPVADVTYYDNTAAVTDISQGIVSQMNITFATGYTYDTNIWIDFNDNFEFEESERVMDTVSVNQNPTTLDVSFPVPVDAPLGMHRMRIGTADSGQQPGNPCYSGAYGVTVDMMVNVLEPPAATVDWANLQSFVSNGAAVTEIETCQTVTVYSQGYEPGITDSDAAAAGAGIEVWIAMSPDDTDPSTWSESLWMSATYNVDVGNNDEFSVDYSGLAAGTYYFASRWQLDGGLYVYGGNGGLYDGATYTNAVLTVVEPAAVTASADIMEMCLGETATLSVSSDDTTYMYVWDNGAGSGESVMVTPTETTTYTVTGTNDAGCEVTASVMIVVNELPTDVVVDPTDPMYCVGGDPVLLTATGGEETVPTMEGFETDPPAGWTFYQSGSDDPGFVQTALRKHSGDFSFYHNDNNITDVSESWMVSPSYLASSVSTASFWYNHNYTPTYYNYSGVWVSTTGADPVANPGDWTELQELIDSEDTWTEVTSDLSSYDGQMVYIAFKYVGDFDHELYIDDFTFTTLGQGDITWSPTTDLYTDEAMTTAYAGEALPMVYAAPAAETTYTATATTVAGCTSTADVIVTLGASPDLPVAEAQSFCSSDMATIADIVATGDNLEWYDAAVDGNMLMDTDALVDGTSYFVQSVSADGCVSERVEVVVTINASPALPVAEAQTFCDVDAATIADLVATGDNLEWYDAAVEGNMLMDTEVLVDGTSYYVQSVSAEGCASDRVEVMVTLNTAPDAPTADAVQEFCPDDAPTVADLVATGTGTIVWYDAATDGNMLMDTDALASGTVYYAADLSAEGCESASRAPVAVNLNTDLCAPENDDCANAEMLTVEAAAVPGTTMGSTTDLENACDTSLTGSWYTVTGDGADLTVTVTPSSGWDPSLSVMTGDCTGGFTCLDEGVINNGGDGEVEAVTFPSDAGVVYYIMTGGPASGAQGDFAIQVTSNLGIEDVANIDNSIALYPNPVVDVLYLNTEQEIAVAQVFTLDGSLVKEITNLTDNAINVHSLNQGTYILRVILADHTVVTEKFIKR